MEISVQLLRITSYNVCYTKLLRVLLLSGVASAETTEGLAATDIITVRDAGEVTRGTLLFRHSENFRSAPILETGVQMDITGMIVRVRVRQRFHNPDTVWQEGIYVFRNNFV